MHPSIIKPYQIASIAHPNTIKIYNKLFNS